MNRRLEIYRACVTAIQTTRAQLAETSYLLQTEYKDRLRQRLRDLRQLKARMERQLGPRIEEPDDLPPVAEIIDIPTDDELKEVIEIE